MQVLLIEPDHILSEVYGSAFKKAGFKIRVCVSAQDSISAIDKKKPDLIVLEIQLAGHSGFEFLHELRSYEDLLNIPVIVYSSVPEISFENNKQLLKKLGVTRYLNKSKTSINQLVGIAKSLLMVKELK
jgi:DNA-binding response OmpR family regulator